MHLRSTDSLQLKELWSKLISNKTASIWVRIIILCLISVTCIHHPLVVHSTDIVQLVYTIIHLLN